MAARRLRRHRRPPRRTAGPARLAHHRSHGRLHYYWILHAHPVAILGYCAVLEGNPPSTAFIDTLAARTGYPAEAFNTLRHHSDIDIGHGDELFALIDHLPLNPANEAVIGTAALQTADLLIEAADELLQSLPGRT